MKLNRRTFLVNSGTLAAAAVSGGVATSAKAAPAAGSPKPRKPYEGIGDAPFAAGEPCLQAPAETTMGVAWKVSGLSKGVVGIADNPEMRGARTVKAGGYGLVPIDVSVLQVRLENLKPATTYWYRTVSTPFTDYKNIYDAKLGKPVVGKIHSFTTMGATAHSHFCMMCDTHARWEPFELIVAKLKELRPAAVVWAGDATNTTQEKETAVEIFLDPQVKHRDYAADIPVFFVAGNHDFRGSWISKLDEVVHARHPAERTGAEWDLKWNFAVRLGDVAMIGLDTGEDKPDGHPKWFGLANFSPYRRAQAEWLARAFERPEIASAPHKVVFCHIPLYAAPDHPDYPHDGVKIDPQDYAYWSRECNELWNPLFEKHGVKLVVAGHKHCLRIDPPSKGRSWHQIVGGGPELGRTHKGPDASRFPTVIEGKVENGKLVVTAHDVWKNRVAAKITI
jgi:hypothetical protein